MNPKPEMEIDRFPSPQFHQLVKQEYDYLKSKLKDNEEIMVTAALTDGTIMEVKNVVSTTIGFIVLLGMSGDNRITAISSQPVTQLIMCVVKKDPSHPRIFGYDTERD